MLRHGIVYHDGDAWTGKHDNWLRPQALPQLSDRATRLAFDSDYDAVLVTNARRDRLDAAIGEMAGTPSSPHWCGGWAACSSAILVWVAFRTVTEGMARN